MKFFGGKKRKDEGKETRLRRLGFELLKLSGLALILSPANVFLANFLLFHPERDTLPNSQQIDSLKARFDLTWTDEFFAARDGTNIHGWHVQVPGSKKTFLVSHGNAGNLSYRLRIIEALAGSGGSIFLYEYRGYGQSDGQPSAEGIVHDGIGAYDYLVNEKKVAPEDVVLYGESLGCAVATAICENRKVCGVVLQSPFATLVEAARDRLPWYRLFPDHSFPQSFLDNLTAYQKQHPPLLLMHGEQDWILPCRYSREIFAASIEPKQLVLLPNCAHNDVYMHDLEISSTALKSFVEALISPTVANGKIDQDDWNKQNSLSVADTRYSQ